MAREYERASDARATTTTRAVPDPLRWLEDERRDALTRAEALRAKVLASRRLLSEELHRRRAREGRARGASGATGRGSDGFDFGSSASATTSSMRMQAREPSARVKTDGLRRDAEDLNGKLDDLRRKLERATSGSEAVSASASPTKPERASIQQASAPASPLDRSRETMRERYERELSDTRASASASCDELKRRCAALGEELDVAKGEYRATVEQLEHARAEVTRLTAIGQTTEEMHNASIAAATAATVREYEGKLEATRANAEQDLRAKVAEVESLQRELKGARDDFERLKSKQSETIAAQVSQQTTIQHNLVKELTDAKTEERAGRMKIKELESRLEEVTRALDIATSSMSHAAKDQNNAVSRSERELNSSFDERELSLTKTHKERERALEAQIEELEAQNAEALKKVTKLEREFKDALDAHASTAKSEREATEKVERLTDEVASLTSALERAREETKQSSAHAFNEHAARVKTLEKRINELEGELERALARYERNEAEYQSLIEDVTYQNAALKAKSSSSSAAESVSTATLRAQNEKLKIEVQSLSQALADIERADEEQNSGFLGFFGGGAAASGALAKANTRISDLETEINVVRTDAARTQTALEEQLAHITVERDALRMEKSSQSSFFSTIFGLGT